MARTIAVDWLGAKSGSRRKIWLAESAGDQLIRLENGRTREELAALLIHEAATTGDIVVGLDFAFSFPAWFLKTRVAGSLPLTCGTVPRARVRPGWRHARGRSGVVLENVGPPTFPRSFERQR